MTNGEPLIVRGRDEADLDPDQAAALGRHRDQGAGAGAARAHRLDRRPGGRRGRRGDGRAGPRPLLPREVRRRPHRRRARRRRRRTGSGSIGGAEPRTDAAIVFIGFMGAGKSTRRCAPRATPGWTTVETDELLEAELGMPIADVLRPPRARRSSARREAGAGRRELLERADGGAIALGGGSVLSERVREALAGHVVVWLAGRRRGRPGERVEGSDRPLARDRETLRPRCSPSAGRSTRRSPTRSCRRAPGRRSRGRCRRCGRCAELPAGTRMAWARERVGRVPGLRRPRPAGQRAAGRWRAGASASPTPRSAASTPTRSSRSAARIEVEPGRAAKTLAEAERVLRELARRRDDARRPPRRARRRRRRRPRRLLRRHLPARRRRSSRCRRRSSPRSTPPTAARPASTCRRPRTTSAPTTCPPRCSPTRRRCATLPARGARRRLRRGAEDRR